MPKPSDNKVPVSMRISAEGLELLEALSKRLGVNRTSITEIAIRRMAEQEKVTVPVDQSPQQQAA